MTSATPPRNRLVRLAWMGVAFLLVQSTAVSSALAATFTVTKTTDTNDGTCSALDCSLREAVAEANTNAGADTIVLGSGLTYTLTLGPADPAGLVVPGAGDLDLLDGELTILGNGSTVNAGGIDRAFDIRGAITVTIHDLTITGGAARGFLSAGGGLNIRGASVALHNSIVTANATFVESGERDPGGGIAVVGSFDAATGVAALASLTLFNTTVSGNTGSSGGGIVCVLCALTTSNSSITGNDATAGDGGGVALAGNSSTFSMLGSAIALNSASAPGARGGGVSIPVGAAAGVLSRTRIVSNTAATGSGVFSSQATVTAANNWWGCNFGPGTSGAGCTGTPNGVAGTVTSAPFLVLKSSTSPTWVLPGGSSTLTADVTINSVRLDTSSGGTIPNGNPVSFAGTLGAFASPSSTTTNGKADGLYSAGGTVGTATLTATLDGQTVSSLLRIGSSWPTSLDFDGDGPADHAVYRPSTGDWLIPNQPVVQWGIPGDVPAAGDYDGDGAADRAVYRPSTGEWFVENEATVQWGLPGDIPVPGDYTGDGITDRAVYRPSTGEWFVHGQPAVQAGSPGDVPVPGDYNGDLSTDRAVYRPSTGEWLLPNEPPIPFGLPGDIPVPGDYDGDLATDLALYRPSTGEWLVLNQAPLVWGLPGDVPVPRDYDGDGATDVAIYRPATGGWFVHGHAPAQWGIPGDLPVPRPVVVGDANGDGTTDVGGYLGDFDGNGAADVAVFRSSTGDWFIDGQAPVQWGQPGDIIVPGDYDGNGRTDLAAYRPSNGLWFVQDQTLVQWGLPGDLPAPGDYDGDGTTDVAVYRPSTGEWFVHNQGAPVQWGLPGDVPVPGDYDANGTTDIAVYRPSTGQWFVRNQFTVQWGQPGDVPIPGDYNGDGTTDVAVFRPATGFWFVRDQLTVQWGLPGDLAVPGDFNGDGLTDIAVYRPSNGFWFVRSLLVVQWGVPGDIPASRAYVPR